MFSTLAFIEGLGGPEVMMIMFIILLLFGANKLPELAKGLGKSVKEFKKAASDVEYQIKEAMEEKAEESAESKRFAPKPVTPVAPAQTAAPTPAPADGAAPTASNPPAPDAPKV
jgi:sec-independent protein translocase protein TatA